MDTQNTNDPVSWLLLAKKHFKPKTIEVWLLLHHHWCKIDRDLPSSTYIQVCAPWKRHVLNTWWRWFNTFSHVGDFRGRLENFFIVFEGKQRIRCKIHIQIIHFFHWYSYFVFYGYKVITVLVLINVFQIIPCNRSIVCFIHKLYYILKKFVVLCITLPCRRAARYYSYNDITGKWQVVYNRFCMQTLLNAQENLHLSDIL